MGFHTFDPAKADRLDDVSRFRFCSREELLGGLGVSRGEAAGDGTRAADAAGGHLVDLGSGTGFYTAELAPFFQRISAVDVQAEMHALFRQKGLPAGVDLLEGSTDDLPIADDEATAAVSTMTAHELPLAATLRELDRVLVADSPVVVVDWSRVGRGERGPPVEERHDADHVANAFRTAGFTVERAVERAETFVIEARRE